MMYGSCYLHLQAALPREERALLAAQIRRGDLPALLRLLLLNREAIERLIFGGWW